MIFDKDIDKNLYIILSCDIKSRENISGIIYNMPRELLDRIRIYLSSNKLDGGCEYRYAKRDNDNNSYMYVVNVCNDYIYILCKKWNNLEENIYKLVLGYEYIGTYSEEVSILVNNLVVFIGYDREYEIVREIPIGSIISLSSDKRKYSIVNIKKRDINIELDDLKDRRSVCKLVRRRKKCEYDDRSEL